MTSDGTTRLEPAMSEQRFDLEQRTAAFGEAAFDLARTIKQDVVTRPLIGQLVRSATSVKANCCEADDAGTRKEFRHRISLCRREARETKVWLRMITRACPDKREPASKLWVEAKELRLIFAAIFRNSAPPPKPTQTTNHRDRD